MHLTKLALSCCLLSFLSGTAACLDPLTSEELGPSGSILPAGTTIPDAHSEASIEQQISDNDGVDSLIPLLSGFAGGQPVRYWDFGESVDFAIPLYIVVKRDSDEMLVGTGHHNIIDSIPGDSSYSPYWKAFYLEVADQYNGELLPSFAAVEEAIRLGLVKAPVDAGFIINCPVTSNDVRLELDEDGGELSAPSTFYWNGMTVNYFDFGPIPGVTEGRVKISDMYSLHREGREVLSEPARGVDITSDGDIRDTNNIFSISAEASDYTPLVRIVSVAVPLDTLSVDTFSSDTESQFKKSEDLFDPGPNPIAVVAFEVGEAFLNRPQQATLGAL